MRDWPRAARWLVAELVPFGCLLIGMLVIWAGVAPVGFLVAFLANIVLTVWYLNWVQDTHPAWVFPLLALLIPATYLGDAIFSRSFTANGNPVVVTPAYWEAFGGLLAALAVTVALAVVNGERHRGRYSYIVTR
jgi:hypothetical protein